MSATKLVTDDKILSRFPLAHQWEVVLPNGKTYRVTFYGAGAEHMNVTSAKGNTVRLHHEAREEIRAIVAKASV